MRININWNSEDSIKASISELQKLVNLKEDKNFTVLNIIKNENPQQSYHILVKHICGFEYTTTKQKFLTYDRGCPHCLGILDKYNSETFKEYCKNIAPDYEILGEYKNTKTKIEVKHKKCGNKYFVTPNHFIEGKRCPFCCNKNTLKSLEEAKKDILNFSNGQFELIGEYFRKKYSYKI